MLCQRSDLVVDWRTVGAYAFDLTFTFRKENGRKTAPGRRRHRPAGDDPHLEKSIPAAQGQLQAHSILGRILSQLAYAGVQKTVVVALGSTADIADDFGDDLNGMELCIRAVRRPVMGRLIESATAKEIAEVDGNVLIITENLVFDFSLIERLLKSKDRNIAVVRPGAGAKALRILADTGLRLTAVLPETTSRKINKTALGTVGIYSFEAALLRSIGRSGRQRTHDDYEFFETAIRLHGHPIHVMYAEPNRVMRVSDAADLVAAEFAFSSYKEQFETVERLHGGYWRYPVSEHILLSNVHFPPSAVFDRVTERLPDLLHLYPSGHCEIAAQIAEMANLPPDFLAVGNGASEIIRALYGELNPTVAIPTPTFIEYQNAISPNNVRCFELPSNTFDLHVDEFARFTVAKGASVAVVVNPNNPTGRLVPLGDLRKLASSLAAANCRLVIDESFIEFARGGKENSVEPYLSDLPNTVVVKSIGKIIGLGGVRLGYLASADAHLVLGVRKRLPLWNINGIAEYLLWVLPEFRDELEASFEKTREDIASFSVMLRSVPGFQVLPSQANYLFCRIPNRWPGAKHAAQVLATEYGLLVRHCGYQSMKDGDRYLRLTARTEEENRFLISALQQLNNELNAPTLVTASSVPSIQSLPDESALVKRAQRAP